MPLSRIRFGRNKSWSTSARLALRVLFYTPLSFAGSVADSVVAILIAAFVLPFIVLFWLVSHVVTIIAGLCGWLHEIDTSTHLAQTNPKEKISG